MSEAKHTPNPELPITGQPESAAPLFELDYPGLQAGADINHSAHPHLLLSEDQEQAFADQVNYIAQNGDATDIPAFGSPWGFGRGTKTYLGVGAVEGLTMAAHTSSLGAVLTGMFIGSTATVAHSVSALKARSHAKKALGRGAQTMLNERYDIFFADQGEKAEEKGPLLLMRYYGSLDADQEAAQPKPEATPLQPDRDGPITPLDRVQRMARLAGKYNIDGIVLSEQMLQAVGESEVKAQLGEKPYTMAKLVRFEHANKAFQEKVAVHPPAHWLEMKDPEQYKAETDWVKGMVDVFRQVNPEDKIVMAYDDWTDDDPRKLQSVYQAAQQFASAELSEVVRNRVDLIEAREDRDTAVAAREHWEASFDDGDIVWTTPGKQRREKLSEYLHLDEAGMRELLEAPLSDIPKAKILAAGLMATRLPNLLLNKNTGSNEEAPKPLADVGRPMFDQLFTRDLPGRYAAVDSFYHGPTRRPNLGHASLSAAAGLTSGVFAFMSGTFIDQGYEADVATVERMLDEQGKLHDAEHVDAVIAANSPLDSAWKDYRQLFVDINMSEERAAVPPQPLELGGNAFESTSTAKSDWDLRPTGDMNVAGYWTMAVASKLQADTMSWLPSDTAEKTLQESLPLNHPYNYPNIEVGRYLNIDDVTANGYIRIPVLEGLRPVAANINGKPVGLVELQGGTYALKSGTLDVRDAKLTYWLESSKNALTAHAYERATAWNGNRQLSTDGMQKVWEDLIPDFKSHGPRGQLELVHDYIMGNFDYRLMNIYEKYDNDPDILAAFTRVVLKAKKANCFFGNTAEVMQTMRGPEPVNLASGYRNLSGGLFLSDHGLHAWGINQYGGNKDATPGNVRPEEQAWLSQVPAPNQPHQPTPLAPKSESLPEPAPIWPYGVGLTALLSAGVGITQRKSLNEQRRQFQAQYNRWSLARNPQLTKFAGEISDAMQWDPDRDVRAAIHRVQAADMDQHTIDVTAAVKKVLRPEIHGKGVDQLFGRALAESPTDEETDILRQTHKILRRARWVHEHPKPQKRPAGQRNDGTGQLQL